MKAIAKGAGAYISPSDANCMTDRLCMSVHFPGTCRFCSAEWTDGGLQVHLLDRTKLIWMLYRENMKTSAVGTTFFAQILAAIFISCTRSYFGSTLKMK
jgi:hypothetical protein